MRTDVELPAPLATLPRLPLGSWPTAVEPLEQLSRMLGHALWVKRDDQSGALYGGNKIRKLERLLAAAQQRGATTICTVGAKGSHHVLATALYCQHLGLQCLAFLIPRPMTNDAWQQHQRTCQTNATLMPCASAAHATYALLRQRSHPKHYLIAPGGSGTLGTLAYVAAAYELRQQIAEGKLPLPELIYVALGSGSTAVGLALGCAHAGLPCRIRAVRVAQRFPGDQHWLEWLCFAAANKLGRSGLRAATNVRLELIETQLGPGYGHPTPAAEHASALASIHAGLHLETTYTAKTFAALLADAAQLDQNTRARPDKVLFWNTFSSIMQ